MTTMTKDAKFWDQIAPKYAKQPVSNVEAYEATLARTRTYLNADDHVLELGCGTGTTALKLAPSVKTYRATDVSEGMISIARSKPVPENAARVTFAAEPVLQAKSGEAPYDAVLAFNLLHLLPDLHGDLAKIRSQLKPGGYFISKTPCLGRNALHFRAVIAVLRLFGKAPSFVRLLNFAECEAAIRDAGFEFVETGLYPERSRSRFIVARAI